ncbi:RimK-like ATPgrasp N-terminal domain-containing protein [Methanoregula sp.]|uniref:RimK-like ATPgrasp N-terminal domain-containing protein n=1 Tax=Methanoregula sp. TaxID=2052170 RepID=UPI00236C4F9E|nr:RimK-like ATPgrasp N-terminal domain-containing protein [Methanoregula sp.]MDD1686917.1 RimK-like ATPgrasp N-terminal domain-containing protein [Methanoregula sp.]
MNSRCCEARAGGNGKVSPDPRFSIPALARGVTDTLADGTDQHTLPSLRKTNHRISGRKDCVISRDALYTIWHNNAWQIISEDYAYKTETYYSILKTEMEGKPVQPASADVIDAYVVPVCLERAHLAGIPVCDWGISQGYAPLPSMVYGLNYFATASEYSIIHDSEQSKEVVKHITNKGKYPFCYQKLDDGFEIGSCIAIFGKTARKCSHTADIAERVYNLFGLPLVTMVYVKYGNRSLLSSLAPVKYSQMSPEERSILSGYITGQEHL